MINTVGPVWDGNEVWVLVAGGATFAAFPEWYATLFSGFYLPLLLILVGLIVRGLSFEYRHKRDDDRWRGRWDLALIIGSFVPSLLWGVAFANIVAGVPIDADKEFTGNLFTLLNPFGLLGGLVTLTLFATHGAMFVALKTDGDIRHRARALAVRIGAVAALLAVVFLVWTQLKTGTALTAVVFASAALALLAGLARSARRSRGLGVRGHLRHDRARGGGALPRALPRRDAVEHRPRLLADHDQRGRDGVHAEGHDLGGRDLHPGRAGLPGVDLLGLPQAHRGAPHPHDRTRAPGTAS